MKAFIRGLILTASIFATLFVFKPYSVHAAVQYNDYQEQYNVSPKKVWKIRFSNPVNWFSAQNSVYVYDNSNNVFPVTITTDASDSRILVITPNRNYDLGKRYCMVINSSIYSSNTYKNLKSNVRMYFNIKTKLDPSDYGNGGSSDASGLNGIVIIGSNRAYSVSYLLQHSDLANDVNGDPSKKVYYIPDATNAYYQNVQNLFGDSFTTYSSMSSLHSLKYIDDNIVYTDAGGNNYAYVWNSSYGYYILQTSGVNVTVVSPSTTGAVSLTVNSVNAVSGAAYYKIDGTNIKRKIGQDVSNYVSMQPTVKILILSSNQTEMGYAYVNVSQRLTNTIFPVTVEPNQNGNTTGNSNNNGSVVYGEDGYTYYLNSGDNNTIYKTDDTGEYNQQIGLDKAQYMNEQNGWIYYSNYSDNQKIYRIKTDGTRREKVCDDSAAYLVVNGDWIYYSNHSEQGRLYRIGVSAGASTKDDVQPDPSTYKIDPAGTHGLPIDTINSSQTVPYDEVAYINVSNNWVYYVNNSDDHKIYKIDTDGNFRTKVNDEWSECPQVVDDEIYYCSKTGEIMKIGTDGNSTPVDLGGQADNSNADQTFSINVSGDWIYYSNKNDNKTLYKVKNDGSGEKYKLTNFPIYYVMVAGNKLYIDSTSNIEYTLPIDTTGGDIPVPVGKTTPDTSIVKVNDITKVVEYQDVNQTIEWLEDKYLPEKVTAVMSDNKQQELTVNWDKANKTFSGGIWYYTGTILGYTKTVNLKLIIPSQMLNGTNDINITHNPGGNDYVSISPDAAATPTEREVQAKYKDIIRVYADENKTTQISKDSDGVIGKNGKVKIPVSDIYAYGDAIYVTIQRNGKYESNTTKILQMQQPTITKPTGSDMDDDTNKADFDARDTDMVYPGVDGRDFTIYNWNEAHWDTTDITNATGISNVYEPSNGYNQMYIVPSNTTLDMTSSNAIKVDGKSQQISVDSSGTRVSNKSLDSTVTQDSLTHNLLGGYYSIYIARHYDLSDSNHQNDIFVTADPNGSRPVVTADIASVSPATEEATYEDTPVQRKITAPNTTNPRNTTQVVVSKDATISLDQPVSSGEEVWFVPSNFKGVDGYLAKQYGYTQTDKDCLDDFYNNKIFGGKNNIIRVQNQPNDFNASTIGLTPGTEYNMYIMNNVGARKLGQSIIPDFSAPTINMTVPSADNTGANYNSASTNGADKIQITYNDLFSDGGDKNTSIPGKIYLLYGQVAASDVTRYTSIFPPQALLDGGTYQVSVASLPQGTDYVVTIAAVDAAGNVSVKYVTVTNKSNGGGSST
ncbi:DUF5050 domain-containing protein [Clostridium neuense]|uniref:DUF5050 domain-containing protein n=1 Tax=Clostridium neuense TaxID=1728934 RepID=A0ABW8TA78_9CLOT